MDDLDRQVKELISDSERLSRLLAIEKERRGVSQDTLVFLGMANIAQHWWCTQLAVFRSRANELEFFAAYLSDRTTYACRLGLATKLPESPTGLLDLGGGITLGDVERLHSGQADQNVKRGERKPTDDVHWESEEWTNKDGKRVRLFNPALSLKERQQLAEVAAMEGVLVGDWNDYPKRRGVVFQELYAEKYTVFRWNFPWGRYSLVGVPDGLTKEYVYEYKSAGSRFLLGFVKPVAIAQADLYGFFFNRPKKRVHIQVAGESEPETFDQLVDTSKADATLSYFARADEGEPVHPPKAWKCNKCDYRATCSICQAD